MTLKGVNLGGWLVLEKWITPSLFEGLKAQDEYSFCHEADSTRLKNHRDNFITKKDFEWLSNHGINCLRLPVGYWALQDDPPFISSQEYIDKAFEWAQELGLKIILDLHAAPGSQNGHDHSGRAGPIEWTDKFNVTKTLKTITSLSERYCNQKSLWGIELLNEPGWNVPLDLLRQFYKAGYAAVRQNCNKTVAVIISDAFRPQLWNSFMTGAKYKNVVLDLHLYQSFSKQDQALSVQGHLDKTYNEWTETLSKIDKPAIVGEWSLGLDPKTYIGMSRQQKHEAMESYAHAQLEVFSKTAGWFFWNYKTENMPAWDFRHCLEGGVFKL